MAKYRKKPAVVDAWQWPQEKDDMPEGAVKTDATGAAYVVTMHDGQTVFLEDGDWDLPEPDGKHYYPVKPNIFKATYEPVTGRWGEVQRTES